MRPGTLSHVIRRLHAPDVALGLSKEQLLLCLGSVSMLVKANGATTTTVPRALQRTNFQQPRLSLAAGCECTPGVLAQRTSQVVWQSNAQELSLVVRGGTALGWTPQNAPNYWDACCGRLLSTVRAMLDKRPSPQDTVRSLNDASPQARRLAAESLWCLLGDIAARELSSPPPLQTNTLEQDTWLSLTLDNLLSSWLPLLDETHEAAKSAPVGCAAKVLSYAVSRLLLQPPSPALIRYLSKSLSWISAATPHGSRNSATATATVANYPLLAQTLQGIVQHLPSSEAKCELQTAVRAANLQARKERLPKLDNSISSEEGAAGEDDTSILATEPAHKPMWAIIVDEDEAGGPRAEMLRTVLRLSRLSEEGRRGNSSAAEENQMGSNLVGAAKWMVRVQSRDLVAAEMLASAATAWCAADSINATAAAEVNAVSSVTAAQKRCAFIHELLFVASRNPILRSMSLDLARWIPSPSVEMVNQRKADALLEAWEERGQVPDASGLAAVLSDNPETYSLDQLAATLMLFAHRTSELETILSTVMHHMRDSERCREVSGKGIACILRAASLANRTDDADRWDALIAHSLRAASGALAERRVREEHLIALIRAAVELSGHYDWRTVRSELLELNPERQPSLVKHEVMEFMKVVASTMNDDWRLFAGGTLHGHRAVLAVLVPVCEFASDRSNHLASCSDATKIVLTNLVRSVQQQVIASTNAMLLDSSSSSMPLSEVLATIAAIITTLDAFEDPHYGGDVLQSLKQRIAEAERLYLVAEPNDGDNNAALMSSLRAHGRDLARFLLAHARCEFAEFGPHVERLVHRVHASLTVTSAGGGGEDAAARSLAESGGAALGELPLSALAALFSWAVTLRHHTLAAPLSRAIEHKCLTWTSLSSCDASQDEWTLAAENLVVALRSAALNPRDAPASSTLVVNSALAILELRSGRLAEDATAGAQSSDGTTTIPRGNWANGTRAQELRGALCIGICGLSHASNASAATRGAETIVRCAAEVLPFLNGGDAAKLLSVLHKVLPPHTSSERRRVTDAVHSLQSSVVCDRIASWACSWSPEELAGAVFGLGELPDTHSLVSLYVSLRSLAEFAVDHEDHFLRGPPIATMLLGFAKSHVVIRPLFHVFAQRLKKRPLRLGCKPHHVSMAIQAFGLAKYVDKELVDALANQLLRNTARLEAGDVVMVASGFSRSLLLNHTLYTTLGNRAVQLLGQIPPSAACSLVSAFGYVGVPHQALGHAILNSAPHIEQLTAPEAAQMLIGLWQMNYNDQGAGYLTRLGNRIADLEGEGLGSKELLHLCGVLQDTGIRHVRLLHTIAARSVHLKDEARAAGTLISPESCRAVLDTLGMFSVYHPAARAALTDDARTVSRDVPALSAEERLPFLE